MNRNIAVAVVATLAAGFTGSYVALGFTGDGLPKSVDKDLKSIAKDYGKECKSRGKEYSKRCGSHLKAWKKGQVDAFLAAYTCHQDTGAYCSDVFSLTRSAQQAGGDVVQSAMFDASLANVTITTANSSQLRGTLGDFHSQVLRPYEGCDATAEKTLSKLFGKMNKKDACISFSWYGFPNLLGIAPNDIDSPYTHPLGSPGFLYTFTMPDSRFPGDPPSFFCHVVGDPGAVNEVSCSSPFGSNGFEVFPDSSTGIASCEFQQPGGNCFAVFDVNGVTCDTIAIGNAYGSTFDDDDQ